MSWIRPGVTLPTPAERTRRIPVNVPMILVVAYGMAAIVTTLLTMAAWNFATG